MKRLAVPEFCDKSYFVQSGLKVTTCLVHHQEFIPVLVTSKRRISIWSVECQIACIVGEICVV